MHKRKTGFRTIYLIYLGVLIALVLSALLYVRCLLNQYEESQPEHHVEQTIEQLKTKAADGSFWDMYKYPEVQEGAWGEENIKENYLSLFKEKDLTYSPKGGTGAEDELIYDVEYKGGFPLAEIKLKATGPVITKLAVFSMRDWKIESVSPVLKPHNLKLTVPSDFTLTVNNQIVSSDSGTVKGNRVEYQLEGLYLAPDLKIADSEGTVGEYKIQNDRVLVQLYDASVDLPAGMNVMVNGKPAEGVSLSDGRLHYNICFLKEPEVKISDAYGNTVDYDKNKGLPMTSMFIQAPQDYTVKVEGNPVYENAVSCHMNPDYEAFAEYVPEVLKVCDYQVAILKENAEITVADEDGKELPLEEGKAQQIFAIEQPSLPEVPEEVSSKVDVLKVAQNWSLFMSNDLAFSRVAKDLLQDSYQYQVARKYANSIDIQFTSSHTLMDPPFTDISVKNFTWITDHCFSVDISFVKHMRIAGSRGEMEDPMNDRFYFVWHDDTNDKKDNPAWKLVSMKEIIDDAE